jgi:hypothetical protein
MFDPDKVIRHPWNDTPPGYWVGATEYDKLVIRFQKLDAAARFALAGCVDLIATEEGHALEDALGLERS